MSRRRLDAELVRRGLVTSRQAARDAIDAGRVSVAGAPALKVARMVGPGEPIEVTGDAPKFVSRGGHKLDAALDVFDVDVTGLRALDAGASTGGFTDCLLQRGAAEVIAVDVGYGQIALSLRDDPRVDVRERVNVRHMTADDVAAPVDLVVADLSFISLRTVMPALLALSTPAAQMVLLVKPQFEAGRREVAKGSGVIRDPEVWRRVVGEVLDELVAVSARTAAGSDGGAVLAVVDVAASPVRGPDGNREFLAHLGRGVPGLSAELLADRIDQAVDVALDAERTRT